MSGKFKTCAIILLVLRRFAPAPASLLFGLLLWTPGASAYVDVERPPGWVQKYAKYFDELNEFNRTHPCMDWDDYQKARDIWLPGDKQVEDDVYELEKQVAADDEAIARIDAKIAQIKASFERAVQVSTPHGPRPGRLDCGA